MKLPNPHFWRRVILSAIILAISSAPAFAGLNQTVNAGIAAENSGQHEKAIRLYTEVLASRQLSKSNRANVLFDRAMAYLHMPNKEKGIADLTAAIRANPKFAIAYAYRARAYDFARNLDKVQRDAEHAIALDPNQAAAHFTLGTVYAQKKQYDRAIAEFSTVIRLNPHTQDAVYCRRGGAYGSEGHYAKAMADLNMAIKRKPHYWMPYSLRGLVYAGTGKPRLALADYKKALTLSPKAVTYFSRAELFLVLERNREAVRDFSTALHLKPGYVDAFVGRGRAYYFLHMYPKSLADLSRAISLKPNSAAAYKYRGDTYLFMGNARAAIEDYDKALHLGRRTAHTYLARGLAYMKEAKYSQALRDFDQSLKLKPDLELSLHVRGFAAYGAGKFKEAAAIFDRQHHEYPKAYQLVLWRYFARVRMGQTGTATLAHDVKALDPKEWSTQLVRFYLGKISQQELEKGVADKDPKVQRQRECDYGFYVGEYELRAGHRKEATKLFRQARRTCNPMSPEPSMVPPEFR